MSDDPRCVLCPEGVHRADPAWQCPSCFILLHLGCAQKHARAAINGGSRLVAALLGAGGASWRCPQCEAPLPEADYPAAYRCFCGRAKEPADDPWLPAHSCGQPCGRGRDACGHRCVQRCHGGPCAPCTQLIRDLTCFCGREPQARRCGQPRSGCGTMCGRKGVERYGPGGAPTDGAFPCIHACPQPCHDGPCPPCDVRLPLPCACRRSVSVVACRDRDWRCDKPCGRALACGRHSCTLGCHRPGGCSRCPHEGRAAPRSCHCGAEAHPALACDEPTPSCGLTCGRRHAACGHACSERCHAGDCAPCAVPVEGPCRCGRTTRRRLCAEGELLCDVKCVGSRDCTRHLCRRRCCPGGTAAPPSSAGDASAAGGAGGCPPCREPCGRRLPCGNHVHEGFCHGGDAEPRCPRTVTLSCPCGSSRVTVPCGAERHTAPPPCGFPCSAPPACLHATRQEHACHAGACPPCTQPCGRAAEDAGRRCAHPCSLPCHSDGAAAAAGQSPAAAAPCPPCGVPVPRVCVGGHTTREAACSAPALWRCDVVVCGGALPCGKHRCPKQCHARSSSGGAVSSGGGGGGGSAAVAAPPSAAQPAPPPPLLPFDAVSPSCGSSCGQLCSEPRPAGCQHACGLKQCHAGACPECALPVTRPCHCKRTSVTMPCWEVRVRAAVAARGAAEGGDGDDVLCCRQRCSKALRDCDHFCARACHADECDTAAAPCTKRVPVKCGCGALKEDWPCGKRRAALSAQGLAGKLPTAPALLVCDEARGCRPAAAAAVAAVDAPGAGAPLPSSEPAASTVGGTAGEGVCSPEELRKRKKRAVEARREEEAAAAAAAEARRRELELRRRRQRWMPLAVCAALCILAVALTASIALATSRA